MLCRHKILINCRRDVTLADTIVWAQAVDRKARLLLTSREGGSIDNSACFSSSHSPLSLPYRSTSATTIMVLSIPANYELLFLPLIGTHFLNIFLTVQVAKARGKYDVKYPNLYAPESNKNADAFNSIQRAHQNTLESLPLVLSTMFATGLVYPLASALCGSIWVGGRFLYGLGYAANGPKGRQIGGMISHLGDLPLMIMAGRCAWQAVAANGISGIVNKIMVVFGQGEL
jgi:glutathione S-transferase